MICVMKSLSLFVLARFAADCCTSPQLVSFIPGTRWLATQGQGFPPPLFLECCGPRDAHVRFGTLGFSSAIYRVISLVLTTYTVCFPFSCILYEMISLMWKGASAYYIQFCNSFPYDIHNYTLCLLFIYLKVFRSHRSVVLIWSCKKNLFFVWYCS